MKKSSLKVLFFLLIFLFFGKQNIGYGESIISIYPVGGITDMVADNTYEIRATINKNQIEGKDYIYKFIIPNELEALASPIEPAGTLIGNDI